MARLTVVHGSLFAAALIVAATAIGGCGRSNGATKPDAETARTFTPPTTEFARAVGITDGPVTADQARSIAEQAAQGTARVVEREDEDGTDVFGVLVESALGRQDVKVRISDGAVTRIEPDGGGSEGAEDESDSERD